MKLPSFEQHSYENGYSRQEELTFRDCGPDKGVKISTLLSKMAFFGGFDYDARGLTHEKLLQMRNVFLFSRAAIRIHRRPLDREVLDIRTWEDGIRGAHMRRVYEMADAGGEICVSGKSDWILVDPISRKILRPAAFTARKRYDCPKEIACPEPKKIRFPKANTGAERGTPEAGNAEHGAPEALGSWTVPWSALDGNGHLFSGNYGDVVWDFLPAELRERPVREFQINYSKEATLGETLRLVGAWGAFHAESTAEGRPDTPEARPYVMEGIGPDGICFLAEILFGGEKP